MPQVVLNVLGFAAIVILMANSFVRVGAANQAGKVVRTSSDTLTSFLETRMKELNIPGLAIALIENGEVSYHQTFGYANREEEQPVTEQTIFEAASISKSVFAFFVMTYVEEGALDLDKPLYNYLPYEDIAYDDRYKKITARMVLSHRSGFPNWRENEQNKTLKIKFEPGSDYLYSGEGYQYLAMVLKHIEGTDWIGLEAAFQKRVAQPLGLEHTVFIQTPYTQKHKAEPYDENGQWIDWEHSYWYQKNKDKLIAAASLHTEPLDFATWMIAVMNQKLLSPESYNELFKRHSKVTTTPDGLELYYTLGFMTPGEPYQNAFMHGGNNDGFTCWYIMDTENNWGFVLFTNSEYGEQLGNELLVYLEEGES
uniref:Serine hydrolase n=1 Tax=Roseihalotalea indica TaxID=2867963 RepID=A0AA49GN85_9BACT|nr:serine hydrolase [Tunicatimonas sp. TK19036]